MASWILGHKLGCPHAAGVGHELVVASSPSPAVTGGWFERARRQQSLLLRGRPWCLPLPVTLLPRTLHGGVRPVGVLHARELGAWFVHTVDSGVTNRFLMLSL